MATSSQRLSFTQLVLDMGLADKAALRKAQAAIKEAKADGRKLTVARACVDLEILTEKEAKKVQRELKRLKEGFASSEAFHPEGVDPALAEKKKERKRKKREKSVAGADLPEGKQGRKSGDDADAPLAKKKRKSGDDADAPLAKKQPKRDDDADAPLAKKKRKSGDDADAPVAKKKRKSGDDADAPVAKKAEAKKGEAKPADADEDEEAADQQPKRKSALGKVVGGKVADKKSDLKKTEQEASPDDSAPEDVAEEPAPKGKGKSGTGKVGRPVGKSLAKGKSGTGKVPRGKTKVGKEIPLESQRTAKVEGPATKRRGRALADAGDVPAATSKSNAPLIAIVAAVIVLLVLAVAVALKPKDTPKIAQGTPQVIPSEGEVQPDEPQPEVRGGGRPEEVKPKPRSEWTAKERASEATRMAEKLMRSAGGLVDAGKVGEALKVLEEFPADLRNEEAYKEDVAPYQAKLGKLKPEQERLAAALAKGEGGDHEAMIKVLKSTWAGNYAFPNEGFVVLFQDKARELLGQEKFEEVKDLLAMDLDPDAFETEEDYDVQFAKDLEVETRGTPERRQALRAQLSAFQKNLSDAEGRLAAKQDAARKALREQAQRALKGAKNLKTDKGQSCKLIDLTETGFVVEIEGKRVDFGWGAAPPKLGHAVKSAAIDPTNPDELYDLGIYALKLTLFDEARQDFARAQKAGAKRPLPDIDQLATMVDLFRGEHDYKPGKTGTTKVVWKLRDKKEEQDFAPLHEAMKHDVSGGALTVKTPSGFLITAVRVQGAWSEEVSFSAKLGPMDATPGIWFETESGQYLVEFSSSKTKLFPTFLGKGGADAESDTAAKQNDVVTVKIRSKSETKVEVTVEVDGKSCFTREVSGEGEIKFMVGRKGFGEVRFGEMSITGKVGPKWARQLSSSAPSRLARELAKFESRGEDQQMTVPAILRATSAEDAVALEGVPEEAREKVKNARTLFAQGNQYGAMQAIEEAARNPLFHAANYLYGAMMVQRDPTGALIRLERADKGVEDFYEAKTARASALFWLAKYDEARKILDEAMKLRPDYAPAYLVKANLEVNKGDYERALDTLALALELAPGDPFAITTRSKIVALAEGPAWVARKRASTPHYVLDTDMVSYADQFVTQLESIRHRYEEAYPILIDPSAPKDQAASVLIFSEPEGYFQYSDRTGVGRVENTLGHFNPWSGQLLLFLEEDPSDWNSFHVIFHEGMHQWCHSNGLELPFWANEGMAEYVGGTRLSDDGKEIVERGAIDSFLKKRLMNLTSSWGERLDFFDIAKQSPQEFYAGNAPLKYAQAWTMIHFFMESGYPRAKELFFKYLEAYKNLKSPEDKKSAQEGSKMQYIWNDTLGQLNRDETKAAWEKYIEKLAKRAKLPWKLP